MDKAKNGQRSNGKILWNNDWQNVIIGEANFFAHYIYIGMCFANIGTCTTNQFYIGMCTTKNYFLTYSILTNSFMI